jgi:glutathione S-transferase
MTCAENGIPFELSVVDVFTGAHKQKPHTDRQPFGRIPAISDDGFDLFESRAICRYLNEKYSGKLVPGDAKGRAKMEQWISIETSEFTNHAMKFIYEHTFKRPQGASVLEDAQKALETTLGTMDKQLEKTPFLTGAEFTLADVMYMPYVEYCMATPAKEFFSKYPNVMAWWTRVSERPAWKKAIGAT